MLRELISAIALVLVIEGIMPFVNPAAMRRVLFQVVQQNDRTLRTMGLVSMIIGVAILYFTRH
ncbi:MAG TPA: DUF2065 domain-containing protein [Gammaproteobacteria bacterium]|nr:DUF2065 domain-containing protein [Gammaproteobacteria bacterium]